MHLKISSAKLRPLCPRGDELKWFSVWFTDNIFHIEALKSVIISLGCKRIHQHNKAIFIEWISIVLTVLQFDMKTLVPEGI